MSELQDDYKMSNEEAVEQLLKARRVLRCSYVYGYYLEGGPGYKKVVFECMQVYKFRSSEKFFRPWLTELD